MQGRATPVTINIRLAPDLGLRSWRAEAVAIDASSGGGTYRLTGFSPHLPTCPGDVIRAESGSDSALWMTALVEVAPHAVSMLAPRPGSSKSWMNKVIERFAREGCENFPSWPVLLTKWPAGRGEADILPVVAKKAPDAINVVVLEPRERRAEILNAVMLASVWMETVPRERSHTGYRVGEDLGWKALGMTDPDVLASIQALADKNPRVLATIRAGLYQNVLHYVHRLTTDDPASLPPLDGPLLVDPDAR